MYKVVIVDDESWAIVDLTASLQWERFDFQVTATFSKSQEALDYLLRMPVDVVFTDIRMPRLSGTELIKALRQNGSECEIVIISSFADFSCAQDALRYSVFEYCLKPIDSPKADQLLLRLKETLDKKSPAGVASSPVLCEVGNKHLKNVIAFVQLNLSNKLTLDDIVSNCFITKNYCCNLFSKHMNMTFSQFLLQERMEYAKRLIRSGEAELAEIAQRVGFSDYFYFIKCFKKYTSSTPGEYRKHVQLEQTNTKSEL